ncbi:hypothetical protein Bhyg_09087 [Pseudolycoriella hygida]|uniref:Uncharacterized protein n=1 Tax=Pseudolycoriella hygida TaxID=35572 RepID=A0A9Q0N738_9DIPT|nr:hypothetical protein Bhyg_09087 [Pseudolycoriella hygida]
MYKQIDQSEENDSKESDETENEADASVSAITRNIVKQTENSVKAQKISSNITTRQLLKKAEKTKRIETDTSISTLVTSTVLLKRRYYFKAIDKTILFLVEHHLALRGNWDKEYHEEDGLFNSLFDFAKEPDPDLVECEKFTPSNAKYTSRHLKYKTK